MLSGLFGRLCGHGVQVIGTATLMNCATDYNLEEFQVKICVEKRFIGVEREISYAGEDIESRVGKSNHSSTASAYSLEDRDRNWVSWLIPLFVVANVVMFVVEMYLNNCPKRIKNRGFSYGDYGDKCVARFLGRLSFQPLRENPLFGPSSSTLQRLGALNWAKVVHQHQGWRLISCIWLHAGVIHLLANMLSLVFIGIRLEQQFGFVRIGIIYLVSGFGGSILSSLFIRNRISVGASGALFGLLGAMLSELITNWSIYSNKVAALLTLLVIVLINLAVGILPHVDNFAHIGGFLTGFLLGFILLLRPQFGWLERRSLPVGVRARSKYKAYQYVLWLISLTLLIAGFTVGLAMLFRGVNGYERCGWCRYLSCVPTSKWKCEES
ncbi:UNVERIFIED_CONTAM: RHOMBOID-like protein 3 [Sesamum latifolium]|uniref:RHOMBOID-like protein n=1 Tax=Sesamum latifolium TaxID=2727402 RepID=A0AAW2T891_9LAMI